MRRLQQISRWVTLLFFWAVATNPSLAQERSRHHIVFAIDNSGSMAQTDPTGLRGVAAGLILDGTALGAEVEAGLVLFNDRVESEGQLLSVDDLRLRLEPGPGGIPEPSGSTNMEAALERALGILQKSSAQQRSVVLITDGNPATAQGAADPQQRQRILGELVPHATQTGIRIYALGGEGMVDQRFLDSITRPTGGLTLLFRDSRQLLDRAKELVGRQDDVHLLKNEKLPRDVNEYSFELPAGTDRARVTVVLEDALRRDSSGFSNGQILFSIDGPHSGDTGWSYLVSKEEGAMVGAWTAFLNEAGQYRLQVTLDKPGIDSHGGLRVYVEALSVLDLEVSLSPVGKSTFFVGEQLEVEAWLLGGDGSRVDPSSYQLTGHVELPSAATEPIRFSGNKGSFLVPAMDGSHQIVVEAVTPELGRRKKTLRYVARSEPPITLLAQPAMLAFPGPLGPEDLDIEARFRIYPEFFDGSRPRSIRLAITGQCDLGELRLRTVQGRDLRLDGRPNITLDPEGLDVIATISINDDYPLTTLRAGTYHGSLEVHVPSAGARLEIPLRFDLEIPRFELTEAPGRISLWWDPDRPRRISLGQVETDAISDSQFEVMVPDAVLAKNGLGPLATLRLAEHGGKLIEPQPKSAGSIAGFSTYGPIELPARGNVELDLVIEPSDPPLWTALEPEEHPFTIVFASQLGMEAESEQQIASLGGPWLDLAVFGELSPHGLHLLRWLVLFCGLSLTLFLMQRRLRRWWRFFGYRPGSLHELPIGELRIGEPSTAGQGVLILPASHADLQDVTIAATGSTVSRPKALTLEDLSGGRLLRHNNKTFRGRIPLRDGDILAVELEDDDSEPVWELEYQGLDPDRQTGDIEILECPRTPTLGQITRKVILSGLALGFVCWLMATDFLASVAYGLPGVEAVLLQLLGLDG